MFTRLFPLAYLLINGIIYLVLAWMFVTGAQEWFANLGISLQESSGYTELKTMYIGIMGSLGVFFIIAAVLESWRLPGLVLALISYCLLAAVRAHGLLIVGEGNDFMWQLLWVELISAALAVVALGLFVSRQSVRRIPSN